MDNKNIKERMALLAKKWQENIISASEKEEFEQWYHSFDDSILELRIGEDIDLIKDRIFQSIEKDIDAPKKRKLFLKLLLIKAAAALVIMSVSITLYTLP